MGLDGGTYITRNDVLRGQCWDLNKADNSRSTRGGSVQGTHKRPKLDSKLESKTKWTTCALSEQPLKAPVVADFLGSLYNKVAVLEFLLGKCGRFADTAAEHRYWNQMNANGAELDHLQTKRDMFAVDLRDTTTASNCAEEKSSDSPASYRCPLTDLPCESHPFSAISTCGHIFSDRALQQMTEGTCSICDLPFDGSNVVAINGTAEQRAKLRKSLLPRRQHMAARKSKRKLQPPAPLEANGEQPPQKKLAGPLVA